MPQSSAAAQFIANMQADYEQYIQLRSDNGFYRPERTPFRVVNTAQEGWGAITTTTEENTMESNGELIEAALRYLFKHKQLPDYNADRARWQHMRPIHLYHGKNVGYFVWNDIFNTKLAYIDVKRKLIAVRRETVYLRLFQDFAAEHGYKINQPPSMPNLMRYTETTTADDIYETQESPMDTL